MSTQPVDPANVWRLETPGHEGWPRTARPEDPNKYFMVSADCHVNEPGDLWQKRIEPAFRDRLPGVTIDSEGRRFQKTEGFRRGSALATKQDLEAATLADFDVVRVLGRGAFGKVSLVQHKASQEKYALKIIDMEHLTEREKKLAMSEVEFLRVIHGPTIIKFHESFIEKKNIHIVMDFAEGGSLS